MTLEFQKCYSVKLSKGHRLLGTITETKNQDQLGD